MVEKICDNCMSRVPANAEKCPKCGIHFENTNPGGALPNGWVLGGRYTVGRYIDIDGEGVSYSAIDGNTLQRVIIKEYMPVTLCASRDAQGNIVAKPGNEVLFKTTRMDYAELYGSLLRIGFSEGLIQVLDVLEENNTAYAVMEKAEGPTLTEYLTRTDQPIDATRVIEMLKSVMMGIDTLHASGIVHRGIAPDNIILESGGTAKLGGYATLALRQKGSELKAKLYPGYTAPEQYTASEFEGRYTDIYSLGAVMYRMVTGEAPMAADERKVQDNLRPARTVNKEVPNYLSTAIARCMRLSTSERIQNISDFRLALSGERTKGGGAGEGLFGLTKKQTIIAGSALGAVVLIIIIALIVGIVSGGKKPDSSSVSSSSISVAAETVPDFEGKAYADVIKNKTYTDIFTFGTPNEVYSDTVKAGIIISQNLKAGTAYDGKAEIVFDVSKGVEPVKMPDLVAIKATKEEAINSLKALKVPEEDIEIVTVENKDGLPAGTVVETTPAAEAEFVPGTDRIILRVTGESRIISMPDVTGDDTNTAKAVLQSNGISASNISVNDITEGTGNLNKIGTVDSTNPSKGTSVNAATDKVVLNVFKDAKMVDYNSYVGQDANAVKSTLEGMGYTVTLDVSAENGASGTIQSASGSASPGALVGKGQSITLKVYKDAPAPAPVVGYPLPPTVFDFLKD